MNSNATNIGISRKIKDKGRTIDFELKDGEISPYLDILERKPTGEKDFSKSLLVFNEDIEPFSKAVLDFVVFGDACGTSCHVEKEFKKMTLIMDLKIDGDQQSLTLTQKSKKTDRNGNAYMSAIDFDGKMIRYLTATMPNIVTDLQSHRDAVDKARGLERLAMLKEASARPFNDGQSIQF